jgi:hypothetical protein
LNIKKNKDNKNKDNKKKDFDNVNCQINRYLSINLSFYLSNINLTMYSEFGISGHGILHRDRDTYINKDNVDTIDIRDNKDTDYTNIFQSELPKGKKLTLDKPHPNAKGIYLSI